MKRRPGAHAGAKRRGRDFGHERRCGQRRSVPGAWECCARLGERRHHLCTGSCTPGSGLEKLPLALLWCPTLHPSWSTVKLRETASGVRAERARTGASAIGHTGGAGAIPDSAPRRCDRSGPCERSTRCDRLDRLQGVTVACRRRCRTSTNRRRPGWRSGRRSRARIGSPRSVRRCWRYPGRGRARRGAPGPAPCSRRACRP